MTDARHRLEELSAALRPTMAPTPTLNAAPKIRIRGRSFMALIVAPQPPIEDWLDALDRQILQSANFFADRPVVADLTALAPARDNGLLVAALDGLAIRDLRLIGVEGVDAEALAGTRWQSLPTVLHGRDTPQTAPQAANGAGHAAAAETPETAPSLLINGPVRSGQSICFEDGDVTVVGAVSSGAEVIAGGSIHVYGALRGRALAGLKFGPNARIFCRRLEAEMVGVDRLYRTAEHWGEGLQGCAVQVMSDRGSLRLTALD